MHRLFPPTPCTGNRELLSLLYGSTYTSHSHFAWNISRISYLKLHHAMYCTINIARLHTLKDFIHFRVGNFYHTLYTQSLLLVVGVYSNSTFSAREIAKSLKQ